MSFGLMGGAMQAPGTPPIPHQYSVFGLNLQEANGCWPSSHVEGLHVFSESALPDDVIGKLRRWVMISPLLRRELRVDHSHHQIVKGLRGRI